jgi:hypothetical protein
MLPTQTRVIAINHQELRMAARRNRLVACLLCSAFIIVPGCNRKSESPTPPRSSIQKPAVVPLDLTGAVVIGASVSAGAEVTLPGMPPQMFGGDADLADVLALATNSPRPASFADMLFFMKAEDAAEKQLAAAKAKSPRFLFAVDYLFWHAYGAPLSDDARRALFDKGLARLASFDCPVIVADIPDMSHAIGSMLMKGQVPSSAVLDELNAKLDAWAKDRNNVVLIRLRDTVRLAMASEPVSLGGRKFEGESSRGLLVANGLHTTAGGLIALALECLDQMKAKGVIPAESTWLADAAELKAKLTEQKLAEEKAKAAKEAAPSPAPNPVAPVPAGGR